MNQLFKYGFFLLILLLVLVYWKGATNNINSFGTAANKLILSLSGRKQDGSFADYPGGA